MKSNIAELNKTIALSAAFAEKFGEALSGSEAYLYVGFADAPTLMFQKSDAALAGQVFGKTGWTRNVSREGRINWQRMIEGVVVEIRDAEDLDLNGSPVPPSAFPIQLEDAAAQ